MAVLVRRGYLYMETRNLKVPQITQGALTRCQELLGILKAVIPGVKTAGLLVLGHLPQNLV